MPVLRTGYVIAGAYADKVRRTLFAQTRDLVKGGTLTPQEVARATGELNRILYEIFVNKLKADKGDVVMVNIEYNIEDNRIVWNYDKLEVRVWRREREDVVARALSEVKMVARELATRVIQFEVARIGETEGGDIIYSLKLAGREVGALLLTPLDEDKAVVRGAVLEPTPLLLKRQLIDIQPPVDDFIAKNIGAIMGKAINVEIGEADKAIREIRALVEALKKPAVTPLEEEES
ncbi:MAG: DUF2258 domain-containing protein [Acidilobaceae archaeon]